ncbi:MAG TPA: peroxiredoxin [Candidatus Methylacidiphilales bacterium]|nr:peroxiredoxin [Candidatus Methylacidiphilales bacterium]
MNFLDWLGLTQAHASVNVGDPAPDAASRDQDGQAVRLAELYGNGLALVYFYPKADTPGCTAQACSLRDSFAGLQDRGVRVIGVSSDSPAAQKRFAEKYRLPFTLLADEDHAVANAFGVRLLLGMTHRQAFLIKDGRVIWRDLSASTREHARDVLHFLANSAETGSPNGSA